MLVTECRTAIPAPAAPERERLAALPPGQHDHATLARTVDALRVVEDGRTGDAGPATPGIDVAFWNAERCQHLAASTRLLAALASDVALLCEMDAGMARADQQHTTRAIARALRMDYLYGVEFVELGLGNAAEQARHAGETNTLGLHGAGIASRFALTRPALLRLELDGGWFTTDRGERRIGGRMAMLATMTLGGRDVVVACAHLESHGAPAGRAAQMRVLLDGIESYAPGAPVLLGGDFNTQSAARDAIVNPAVAAGLLAEHPDRFSNPVPHEPLFDAAREAGYDWSACNVPGAHTTRVLPEHPPGRRLAKLDWFFTRDLVASEPRVVEAVDPDTGAGLSDHEVLTVRVSPGQSGQSGPQVRTPAGR